MIRNWISFNPIVWIFCITFFYLNVQGNFAANDIIRLSKTSSPFSAESKEFGVIVDSKKAKNVTIKYLKNSDGVTLLENQELKKSGDKYLYSMDGFMSPGLFKMMVSVDTESGSSVTKVLHKKITTKVEISDSEVQGMDLKFGEKMKSVLKLSSGSADIFSVSLSVISQNDKNKVVPHQCFLLLRHVKKGRETHFRFKADTNKQMSVMVDLVQAGKTLGYLSGSHSVHVIVGDGIFETSLVWDLGEIDLSLPAEPAAGIAPLYSKPLLHESDTTLKPLKEIKHIMRTPDSRPHVLFSTLFSGLVLAPLFGFLYFIKSIDAKLTKFPSDTNSFWALGFFACFGGILLLFFFYWLRLAMLTTLKYLFFLGLLTLIFGHKALKSYAQSCGAKMKAV